MHSFKYLPETYVSVTANNVIFLLAKNLISEKTCKTDDTGCRTYVGFAVTNKSYRLNLPYTRSIPRYTQCTMHTQPIIQAWQTNLDPSKHSSCGHTEVEVAEHLGSRKPMNALQFLLWQIIRVIQSRPRFGIDHTTGLLATE